jgi:hypothetical protein
MANFPAIIGRSEQLEFVDLGIQVPAKVDTGAYRSAVHFTSAKEIRRKGHRVLRVELLGHPCATEVVSMEFKEYELVAVRNSFGDRAIRYKIRLRVKLGSKVFWASFTLADRSNNLIPVLVGRELLKNRFLVDVSKTGIDRRKLRKIYAENSLNSDESEQ